MPWDYVIFADKRLVYSRGWGDVTDADVLDHQRRLAEDPQFRNDFSQLIDFLGANSLKALTFDGIRKAAQRHVFGPGSRRAIVVSDAASFGLARMFKSYRDIAGGEEQVNVFRSLEDAWAWLGMSPREGD